MPTGPVERPSPKRPAARPHEVQAGSQAPQQGRQLDPGTREALIRLAAYSFYERRGFVGGHELQDWLEAEMQVDRQLAGEAGSAETK
jgi:hypothetical protein